MVTPTAQHSSLTTRRVHERLQSSTVILVVTSSMLLRSSVERDSAVVALDINGSSVLTKSDHGAQSTSVAMSPEIPRVRARLGFAPAKVEPNTKALVSSILDGASDD